MPWTEADVEKHKKGLSDKGKKQWTRIANSVLKREMEKGVPEKKAAATAIKEASGVVMNTNENKGTYIAYKLKQVGYEPKLVVHQDKAHLVAPVVMMVEGVHAGSQGPLLHEISELGKFPASWNGIPVIIYHPKKDGEYVSANDPDIVDREVVGRVYNTEVDDKKLKAEIWLDEDKLNTVSEKVLNSINNKEEIEVSLGMFTDNEMVEGEYNGEEYVGIARNHRPDHLAILPDQVGACSLADGCGVGANTDINKMINTLSLAGFAINQIGNNADVGYREKMDAVNTALRKLDTNSSYNYLEDMNDESVIYTENSKDGNKIYKQTYKYESGKIEFVGTPVEVHRKVDYIVNQKLTRTKFNNNIKTKEDTNMPKNDCPKCTEKINAVVTNTASGFVEADREWLETLSEVALDKVLAVKTVEKVVEKQVEVNVLSAEDKAALADYRKQQKDKKDATIKLIMDNSEQGAWTTEELGAMKDDVLAKIAGLVKKEEVHDYSFQSSGSIQNNAGAEEPLAPTGVEFETVKK